MTHWAPRVGASWIRPWWIATTMTLSATNFEACAYEVRTVHFGIHSLHNVLVIHSSIRCAVLEKNPLYFYFAFPPSQSSTPYLEEECEGKQKFERWQHKAEYIHKKNQ